MIITKYIEAIEFLEKDIVMKLDKLELLEDKLLTIPSKSYTEDPIKKSISIEALFEKTIDEIIDLENDIAGLEDKKQSLLAMIQEIDDDTCIDIIKQLYLEKKDSKAVAKEFQYSERHIKEIEKLAINKLENIILQKFKRRITATR